MVRLRAPMLEEIKSQLASADPGTLDSSREQSSKIVR